MAASQIAAQASREQPTRMMKSRQALVSVPEQIQTACTPIARSAYSGKGLSASINVALEPSSEEQNFMMPICCMPPPLRGLVTALGNLAPEVDAALATASSPSPAPQKTEECKPPSSLSSPSRYSSPLSPPLLCRLDYALLAITACKASVIGLFEIRMLSFLYELLRGMYSLSDSALALAVDCITLKGQGVCPPMLLPPPYPPPLPLSFHSDSCPPVPVNQVWSVLCAPTGEVINYAILLLPPNSASSFMLSAATPEELLVWHALPVPGMPRR
ncbi:unnamed protein product [Dibothriocephalus latus]|uniref:Uncharacterized protein n=1 Tax=Dibothriocephalus latus TaxID=60516 RepID=A0A3P7LSG1_DIBLA|nr:unnamed protein product [Dibothriocephalus latus]